VTGQQLPLVDVPPLVKLTDRQQTALAFLQSCGTDGCTASELGRALGATRYARETGQDVARALAKKGAAKYRRGKGDRPGAWIATNLPENRSPADAAFGEFPAGF
jgi:hypothetical protein